MHKTRMKTLATAMLAASLLTGASATEYTWTGEGGDNSWSNPANWGGNGYPDNETDVANFGKTAPTIDLGNGDFTISTFASENSSMSGVTVLENGRLVATTNFKLGYKGKTFGLQLNNAVVVDKAATAEGTSLGAQYGAYGLELTGNSTFDSTLYFYQDSTGGSGAQYLISRDGANKLTYYRDRAHSSGPRPVSVIDGSLEITGKLTMGKSTLHVGITNGAFRVDDYSFTKSNNPKMAFDIRLAEGNSATQVSFPNGVDFSKLSACTFSIDASALPAATASYVILDGGSALILAAGDAMAADGAKITENGQNWTVVPPAGITEWQLERIGGTVVLTLSAGGSLVSLPTLVPASSAYTGEEQKPGYAESDAYVATFGEGNWTTAGVYAVTFDLTDKEATQWTDGTTDPKTVLFEIAPAVNGWTVEPTITPARWLVGGTPGTISLGLAKFGEATCSLTDEEIATITEPGTHTAVFTVEATDDYGALSKEVEFSVAEPIVTTKKISELIDTETGALTFTADMVGPDDRWIVTVDGDREVSAINFNQSGEVWLVGATGEEVISMRGAVTYESSVAGSRTVLKDLTLRLGDESFSIGVTRAARAHTLVVDGASVEVTAAKVANQSQTGILAVRQAASGCSVELVNGGSIRVTSDAVCAFRNYQNSAANYLKCKDGDGVVEGMVFNRVGGMVYEVSDATFTCLSIYLDSAVVDAFDLTHGRIVATGTGNAIYCASGVEGVFAFDIALPSDDDCHLPRVEAPNGKISIPAGSTLAIDATGCPLVPGVTLRYPIFAAQTLEIADDAALLDLGKVRAAEGVEKSFAIEGNTLYLELAESGEAPEFTVSFVDYDERVIKSEKVKYGRAAVAPEDPTRAGGYVFIGWKPADFSYVVSNMTVVAQYVSAHGGEGDPDTEPVVYMWNSRYAQGVWGGVPFWAADVTPCYGFPSNAAFATARFASDAVVDLEGKSFPLVDSGLVFADGVNVTLRNGALSTDGYSNPIGSVGGTVTFEDMTLTRERVNQASGSEMVFAGVCECRPASGGYANYRPWAAADAKLLVRDGETTIGAMNGYGNGGEVRIRNAVLTLVGITGQSTSAVRNRPLVLENGSDRQARLVALKSDFCLSYSAYSFEIPERGLASAPVEFAELGTTFASAPVTVDVTTYLRGRPVALMRCTSEDPIELPEDFELTLETVPAEAKAARNARLYWENNTLWYKQDGKRGLILLLY